jgi:hypothetical protein
MAYFCLVSLKIIIMKMKMAYWIPRILSVLAICFVELFSFDVFEGNENMGMKMLCFLIHSIPAIVLSSIFILACYRELWGGILYTTTGIFFTPVIFIHNYAMNHSVWITLGVGALLNLPFIVTGGFFIWSHFLKRNEIKKLTKPVN